MGTVKILGREIGVCSCQDELINSYIFYDFCPNFGIPIEIPTDTSCDLIFDYTTGTLTVEVNEVIIKEYKITWMMNAQT